MRTQYVMSPYVEYGRLKAVPFPVAWFVFCKPSVKNVANSQRKTEESVLHAPPGALLGSEPMDLLQTFGACCQGMLGTLTFSRNSWPGSRFRNRETICLVQGISSISMMDPTTCRFGGHLMMLPRTKRDVESLRSPGMRVLGLLGS